MDYTHDSYLDVDAIPNPPKPAGCLTMEKDPSSEELCGSACEYECSDEEDSGSYYLKLNIVAFVIVVSFYFI